MRRGMRNRLVSICCRDFFPSCSPLIHPSLLFSLPHFFHPSRTPPPLTPYSTFTPIPIRASSQPCPFYSSRYLYSDLNAIFCLAPQLGRRDLSSGSLVVMGTIMLDHKMGGMLNHDPRRTYDRMIDQMGRS